MRDDVASAFADGSSTSREIQTSLQANFHAYAVSLAEKYGWEFGGPIAGHLIGQFPMSGLPRTPKQQSMDTLNRRKSPVAPLDSGDSFLSTKSAKSAASFEELLTEG